MMESEHHLKKVLKVLHDEVKVAHATVFRGMEGFEKGREVHDSQILSLSLDLPLIVEFFDAPENAERAAEKIKGIIEKGHIISFAADLD